MAQGSFSLSKSIFDRLTVLYKTYKKFCKVF